MMRSLRSFLSRELRLAEVSAVAFAIASVLVSMVVL